MGQRRFRRSRSSAPFCSRSCWLSGALGAEPRAFSHPPPAHNSPPSRSGAARADVVVLESPRAPAHRLALNHPSSSAAGGGAVPPRTDRRRACIERRISAGSVPAGAGVERRASPDRPEEAEPRPPAQPVAVPHQPEALRPPRARSRVKTMTHDTKNHPRIDDRNDPGNRNWRGRCHHDPRPQPEQPDRPPPNRPRRQDRPTRRQNGPTRQPDAAARRADADGRSGVCEDRPAPGHT